MDAETNPIFDLRRGIRVAERGLINVYPLPPIKNSACLAPCRFDYAVLRQPTCKSVERTFGLQQESQSTHFRIRRPKNTSSEMTAF